MPQTRTGNLKIAAKKLGISFDQYQRNIDSSLKWCYACKKWLHIDSFCKNKRAYDGKNNCCRDCRRSLEKERYGRYSRVPKEERKPRGSLPKPSRDGDKKQARAKVNYAVERQRMPRANTVPCFDCGHIGSDKKHEYDHYKGYDAVNHLEVQCVCVPCHLKREKLRQST
jgi:hypothetical protein